MNIRVTLFAFLTAATAPADIRVILPDDERYARNEKEFFVETTIPGDFKTLDRLVAAFLKNADDAKNRDLSSPFTPKSIESTSGFAGAKPLAAYYRGARVVGTRAIVSFSEGAMRYLNSTATIQQMVKGSIESTIRLHFPRIKQFDYEIDGKIVTDWG